MKIFAKRKRKGSLQDATTPVKERTSFASDPMVEELLAKDPSTWNSKEKRMVKRYQQRKPQAESQDGIITNEPEAVEPVGDAGASATEATTATEPSNKLVEEAEKSQGSNSDGSDSSDEESIEQESKASEGEQESEEKTPTPPTEDTQSATSKNVEEPTTDSGKVDPAHEIYKTLDKLTSKMKRTLSRKLDREGVSALEEVQKEATRLLVNSDAEESKKRGHEQVDGSGDGDSKKGKMKKSRADWSALPPEERLRREEQRKRQTEAAERRVRGEEAAAGHKHPLNSERRRANRRKPKWKNTFKREEKKNHHASGFLVRREPSFKN